MCRAQAFRDYKRIINAPAIDEMLLAAARAIVADGQSKFMDIDMVRVAFGRAEQAPVESPDIVNSLSRLCLSGKLIPFIDSIILRALLRGPKRGSATGGLTTTAQVLAIVGAGNRIAADYILDLVRKRNVLVSFTVPAEFE